jgi:hypothetical protein
MRCIVCSGSPELTLKSFPSDLSDKALIRKDIFLVFPVLSSGESVRAMSTFRHTRKSSAARKSWASN